jgi:hypothetical protein
MALPAAGSRNTPPSTPSTRIFEDVTYAVIHRIEDDGNAELKQLLANFVQSGAKHIELTPNGRIVDPKLLTHIVSDTADFPDYEIAQRHFIQVVKPTWIRNSLSKGKQQNPRQYSPDPALIMSDVVICCADVPPGDKEAIMGGVIAMGGLCSEPLTKLVTHLIALSDDDPKCEMAKARGLSCHVLLPHW